MIDTVRLQCSKALDTDKLKRSKRWGWDRRGFVDASGQSHEWECLMPPRQKNDPTEPHYLRYMPEKELLVLESSLPKVAHGQNVSMLSQADLDQALTTLSNTLCDVTGADVPHVGDWELRGRLDCVYSWDTRQAGKSHVADYLHALKSVELPRHITQSVDREATLYWRNSQRVIRLYDKQLETGLPEAAGLLRFEVQCNHAKRELTEPVAPQVTRERIVYKTRSGRTMNIHTTTNTREPTPNPKAGDVLNWKTSHQVLNNYLGALGADLVIRDPELLLGRLLECYSGTKAVKLMGFIGLKMMYSNDELLERGFKRWWLCKMKRDIALAGASVASSESGLLPPLALPSVDGYTGEPARLAW